MSENKFVKAYDELMEHLYEVMDDSLHSVAEAMDIAKEKTIEGLSQQDIDRVAHFLMRDIEHAADNDSNALSEWFKFDIELLENFALDAFTSIADKTRIELAKIENQANKYHPYQSGDIAGPGTFICDQCGKHIAFKSTSEIPECPECKAKTFTRG
ncbi:MAG: zinc ribbon-containing protein [Methylococcaceae bacterium]